jgi:hypothetical protein
MSVWWCDHADHQMAALLDPDGVFAGVDGDENTCKRGEPLPHTAPPVGLFPDVRVSAGQMWSRVTDGGGSPVWRVSVRLG